MESSERIRLIVGEVLEIDADKISADAQQAGIAEWDSLAQLRLITALEQEFGVKPTMREIAELTSIPAIARYLQAAAVRL